MIIGKWDSKREGEAERWDLYSHFMSSVHGGTERPEEL